MDQDKDQCQDLVNMTVNLRSIRGKKFLDEPSGHRLFKSHSVLLNTGKYLTKVSSLYLTCKILIWQPNRLTPTWQPVIRDADR